jgi:uncharacterized RDD family membrane protein YckC
MQDEKENALDFGSNPNPDPIPVDQSPVNQSNPSSDPVPAASIPPTQGEKTPDPVSAAPAESSAQVSAEYAGFWIRLVAAIIDGIVLCVPYFFFIALLSGEAFGKVSILNPLGVIIFLLLVLVIIAYAPFMLSKFGATLGKMILGLRVVDANGQKIGLGKALLREIIGKWISNLVFSLGFIWVAFDEKKQGWHDKIAGTYVVKTR